MSMHKGIDISNWQADLKDYSILKPAGIEFAILKICEYRADKSFIQHYEGLKAQGLPVGAYIFSHAKTADAVKEEVDLALSILGNRKLDLPLFLDCEADDMSASWKASIMPVALAFGEYVTAKGLKWGIYANRSWWQNKLDAAAVKAAGGVVWCAAYNNTGAGIECDIWQHSDSGKISGYGGKLDMNIMYADKLLTDTADISATETATGYVFPDVKEWDGSPAAAFLAAALKGIGYNVLSAGLPACIKDFQLKSGLTIDGICGKNTWAAILKKI